MKKLITPVGTSIFTNLMDNNQIRDKYDELQDYFYKDWKDEQGRIKILRTTTQKAIKNEPMDSAEIESICRIAEEFKGENLDVYLLATDTILSALACELIVWWFTSSKAHNNITFPLEETSKYVIPDLQVLDNKKFQKGLTNLVDKLDSLLDQIGSNDVIFNITGGYKATIPYLSIFGQIQKIPIYYLFKESSGHSNDLIKMPQAPLNLDWAFLSKYSSIFLELENTIILDKNSTWETYKAKNLLPNEFDNYYSEIKDTDEKLIGLNALGLFIWKEQQKYFYVEIPRTSKYFNENVTKNSQVNQAISELRRRIDEKLKTKDFNFSVWSDDDVKHAALSTGHIYKQSSPAQIRIHYKYEQDINVITVYNYYFITNKTDDKGYSTWMARDFGSLQSASLTTLGLRRKN